ncbi:hypothetical protein M5689_014694 [Euphorbia peplus]|nr:hypothetical protein M5689_014694 [Euphorbia peplus]
MACFSLRLLILLVLTIISELETPCFAAKFTSFKYANDNGLHHHQHPHHHHHHFPSSFKGSHQDSDQVFGAEKRKVYTGPNPLHNR